MTLATWPLIASGCADVIAWTLVPMSVGAVSSERAYKRSLLSIEKLMSHFLPENEFGSVPLSGPNQKDADLGYELQTNLTTIKLKWRFPPV